jgi:hypothetical protein
MDAREVVVHEVQRDRVSRVLDLLREALVRRVKRRIDIRIVRFWRSTHDVLMVSGSGSPVTFITLVLQKFSGLHVRSRFFSLALDVYRHELRIVDPAAESAFHCFQIRLVPVGRELHAVGEPRGKGPA